MDDTTDAPAGPVLVILRHAKSDWDVVASDRERPLNTRGRRQAVEAGAWLAGWLAGAGLTLDLAIVSPARRTRETWELASGELADPPAERDEEAAYAFDGESLLTLVRALGDERAVALVGHNPAVEELVAELAGVWRPMPTASIGVVELDSWQGTGRLVAHGRPPQ